MSLQSAVFCYQVARAANNRPAALRHLHTIRAELKFRSAVRQFQTNNHLDRVRSVFACAAAIQEF